MKKNEVAAPLKFFSPAIETDIPLPATPRRARAKNIGAQVRWPFAEMNVGDSILVPDWAKPTRAAAYLAKAKRQKKLPETFQIEIHATDSGHRVWRTA